MPRGLSATAEGNSTARRAEADKMLTADTTGSGEALLAFASATAFSTNVSADKVAVYEEAQAVLDTRQYHIAAAGGDESMGLAAFAAAQADWLVRREAFEDLWEGGRRFVYGAINAGNMGTEGRFGPFCLLLESPQDYATDLAVFPGDSASRYTDTAGTVDDTTAVEEATAWSDRGHLVLIERLDACAARPQEDWPGAVCTPEKYLEVAIAGRMPLESIAEVRVRPGTLERLRRLRALRLAGEALTSIEANEAHAYEILAGWRRASRTRLAEVS